jgi:hypothetical protein
MKLGLQNYAVILPIKTNISNLTARNIYIQIHNTAQNFIIPHKVVQRLFQHNLRISKYQIFKGSVKENNDSNKSCSYVHDLLTYKTYLFKFNGLWVVAIKQNVNFNIQPPAMFLFFDFRRSGLIESC